MEKVAIAPARVMRIVWFGFILAGIMMINVALTIPPQASDSVHPAFEVAIAVAALVDVVLGLFMRRFLARFARPVPGRNAESAAMNRWFSGNVASLAIIFSCNLFAFVLHTLRARGGLVELLFGVGMISLLLWRPGTPPVAEAGNLPQS
jgi:hypothetical protein